MNDIISFEVNERQYNGLVQLMKDASMEYPTHEYADIVKILLGSTIISDDMFIVSLPIEVFQPVFWYLLNSCLAVFKTKPEDNWSDLLRKNIVSSKEMKDCHVKWVHETSVSLLKENPFMSRSMLIEKLGVSPFTNVGVKESEISLRTWRNEARQK